MQPESRDVRRWLGVPWLVLLIVGAPAAQGADPDLTGRTVVAARIYSLVQQYFAHWDGVARSEIEATFRNYVADVLATTDRKGFDLATLRFIATLHNGHTQFFDDRADGRPLKFRLVEVDHLWIVINSQDRALPRGAIVKTINGRPVDEVVRELSQYVAASNDRLARTHVFSYPGLFPERVSLGLNGGEVVVVDRSVSADPGQPIARAAEGRWLSEGQTAYIRVPSFGDSVFERTAADFVRRFASAPNLIVDVRGNGGGTTPRQLIDALMNRRWRTWQETTPQQIALLEANGVPPLQATRASREQAPSPDAYAGRLFILVDRFCGSACEDFVMPFKETARAVVIGETTQGSSGNPYRADLGSGMRVTIGAVRYRFPDGRPFEGVGIVPDIPIEIRLADVQNNRDAVLDRAERLTREK